MKLHCLPRMIRLLTGLCLRALFCLTSFCSSVLGEIRIAIVGALAVKAVNSTCNPKNGPVQRENVARRRRRPRVAQPWHSVGSQFSTFTIVGGAETCVGLIMCSLVRSVWSLTLTHQPPAHSQETSTQHVKQLASHLSSSVESP